MSTSYRALLQSLDETERDVTRGLGRPVQIKKGRSCCPCCCRNACMWTCMTLAILFGLTVSVGLPILLTVPIESSWHWTHWIRWMPSNPVVWNATDLINDTNVTEWTLDGQEPETTTAVNGTVPLIHQAITQLQEMMEWTKDQYDKTPKIPLIVGLSALLLVVLSIIWLVVYRKIRRHQRRRHLGKLVTDLQSGKTLLNSDDSEED